MPVLSPGFEIETELSIHAVDKRWRIQEIPIDYRDRPEGSESKLDTFSDGMKVLLMILSLFKDYRPLALFSWMSLVFFLLGLVAGVPVIVEFLQTGLVPKLPSALLAVALVVVGMLSFTSGLSLGHRGQRRAQAVRTGRDESLRALRAHDLSIRRTRRRIYADGARCSGSLHPHVGLRPPYWYITKTYQSNYQSCLCANCL